MFLIKNARLIPELTEGFPEQFADVLIEDSTISRIVPVGSLAPECESLNLQGKTLLPGMFDLHMHLYFSTDNFAEVALRGRNEYIFDSVSYAKELLRQGFTTIRDAGNPYYIGVSVRDAVAAGIVPGPRIFTAGRCISPYAKSNDTFPNLYYEVNTPSEILSACRYENAMGVDFLKYMATGSVANLNGVPGALVSSREEIFALQAAAESLDSYAAVHCHGAKGILYCAQAGIRTVEHASMIDSECIETILMNNAKTSIVPTLSPVVEIHRSDDIEPKKLKNKIEEVYAHAHRLVEASRAGVLTGWGTDTSMRHFIDCPGFEFDARRDVGYTNIEMLMQATINSSRIMGLEDRLGTVKEGKLADLVAVDGNPDEDISVMFTLPVAVFKEGVRYF
ncbi:MAG: amidohydrolase family protein [Oscillospiraceae bacterium]|nr:amidohydrolase family protein [Oscillospiraceae bacterium]